MRYTIAAIILFTGLSSIVGCGQTGPLYLPEPESEQAAEDSTEKKPASASSRSDNRAVMISVWVGRESGIDHL